MNSLELTLAALMAAGPFLFVVICLMIAIYDSKYFVIPNELILAGIAIRFLWTLEIAKTFICALIFTGLLIMASILIWMFTKKRLGIGDIKLIFMMSLYANVEVNLIGFFITLISGLAIALVTKQKGFPFAPCIV